MSARRQRTLVFDGQLKAFERLRSLPGLSTRSLGEAVDTVAVHDAADLRLVRSGAVLVRSRSDDGDLWDLSVEPSPSWHRSLGDTPVRWIAPVTGQAAPDVVSGLRRGAPLVEVLTQRTSTRTFAVERSGAAEPAAAQVTVTDVALVRSRRALARQVRLVIDGDEGVAGEVIAAFAGEAVDATSALSPLVALGERATEPVVVTEVAEPTVGAAVTAAIGRSTASLLASDVAARLDLGPAAVVRAALDVRHLRSIVAVLRPELDARRAGVLDRDLRWSAELLDDACDLARLADRVRKMARGLDEAEAVAGGELLEEVERQRSIADDALDRALASARWTKMLDALVDASNRPIAVAPDRSAAEVVVPIATEAWRALRASADSRRSVAEGVDELRQHADRASAVCSVAALAIDAAAPTATRIATAVDALDDLADAEAAQRWLEGRARSHGLDGAFVVGLLCAAQRRRVRTARDDWAAAWDRADGRKMTRWMR